MYSPSGYEYPVMPASECRRLMWNEIATRNFRYTWFKISFHHKISHINHFFGQTTPVLFCGSAFRWWRPPGALERGMPPTPGSLALRASVTGGYECTALRAMNIQSCRHLNVVVCCGMKSQQETSDTLGSRSPFITRSCTLPNRLHEATTYRE